MFKGLKAQLYKVVKARENKRNLKKAQRYYKYVKMGQLFLDFIVKDMEQMKQKNMNRHQRRRWEKEVYKKGQFSPEMIAYYASKVDLIQKKIELQLNPPKPPKVKKVKVKKEEKPIDGAKMYNDLKEKEKKNA